MRYWENWDKPGAAQAIDQCWEDSVEGSFRKRFVSKFQQMMAPEGSILEVGCGSGRIYQALLEAKITSSKGYVGGDKSVQMLKLARQRFPEADLRELDIFDLRLLDKSYDSVISVQVLQHLPYYESALKELVRVANKNIFVVTWLSNNDDKIELTDFYNNVWNKNKFCDVLLSIPRVKYIKVARAIEEVSISWAIGAELC